MKKLLCAFLAVALVAGCSKKADDENDPEDKMEAANIAAYKAVIDIYNTKQFDKMDAYTAQDFVDHSAAPGQKPGLAGYKEHMQTFVQGFPDIHVTVLSMSADSDKIYSQLNWKASFTGEMMGMKPTGKSADVEGMEMVRFKDGKLVERWSYFQDMKMMMQLGLLPDMGAPQAEKK